MLCWKCLAPLPEGATSCGDCGANPQRKDAIRLATHQDYPACATIFLRSRVSGFVWLPPSRFKLEDFEPSIIDEEVWVAERKDQVVGFASIFLEANFLHNLFVEPGSQHAGVGALLLDAFLARVKRPALLNCLTANQRALQFYQKRGWEKHELDEENFGPYWTMIKR
jgi:GNAT superfamily N-acetyltransferase